MKKNCPDVDTKNAFYIYILEEFKAQRNLTGKDALSIFDNSGASDYIREHFESLHTQSTENVLQDLNELFGI